ncbi:MAG: Gfo/Idh/MocA family oxidoreductase [Planctomycetales bacterium]|nr:Gfo/Idh/MocA family oxidoreductase [Planctomycetales bacterium]
MENPTMRMRCLSLGCLVLVCEMAIFAHSVMADEPKPTLRAGIIGLDTSHAIAFTKTLNSDAPKPELSGVRVVAAYPQGSVDIESSVSRVPGYTTQVEKLGVEIVDSIPDLLEKVDVVLLESNDGRPHLEQALPVILAGKPMFIDKPAAGSLEDVIAIFELAKRHGAPVFSSSSLRFGPAVQEIRGGSIGVVQGADAYSPCSLETTHPDLFWYGIHGVELLYTAMGPGCETVRREATPNVDLVVGRWPDSRIGTFRGIRAGKSGYGGQAFGSKAIASLGSFAGYEPLVVEIVRFFKTGKPPVEASETIELYAFMQAADTSKANAGAAVSIPDTIRAAREKALEKIVALGE